MILADVPFRKQRCRVGQAPSSSPLSLFSSLFYPPLNSSLLRPPISRMIFLLVVFLPIRRGCGLRILLSLSNSYPSLDYLPETRERRASVYLSTCKMRYENWDVLLFPEDSNVPIQEFKTECSVTQGRGKSDYHDNWHMCSDGRVSYVNMRVSCIDSPYLSDPSMLNPRNFLVPTGNMTLLPVLTSYIPSLPENIPFRASVHCWDTPRPSRLMDGLMRADDALMFQFQVYIDGIDVAYVPCICSFWGYG